MKLFKYDTITLIDCVLEDNPQDPQFSANTVFERLQDVVLYEKCNYVNEIDVFEWMQANGYSEKDIELFKNKMLEEANRHQKH